MDKLLITGFENFGNYNENVTEVLKQNLRCLGSHIVEYMIFPVRIFSNGAENYGEQIVAKAQEINAKVIISLGMASDIYGVRIESRAVNWVENEKYCLPGEQKMVIDKNLYPKYPLDIDLSKWDVKGIFSALLALNMAHEPEVSTNANAFCCNALIFRTLQAMERIDCNIPYIYLHFPCSQIGRAHV